MRYSIDWYYELSRAYTHQDVYVYLKRPRRTRYRSIQARTYYVGMGRPRPEHDIEALYTLEEEILRGL